MADLVLEKLNKTFGTAEVIPNVDLQINDGEFVVFVGPSGCGKSTLLRMIAGLEESTSGDIRIDDKSVIRTPAADRGVAMVFQSYALYPHMTVRENLSFGLENIRMKKEEIQRRVNEAARLLQIDQLLDRQPRQLSGGQRQRVAIGRAITRDPKIFLFDEPLSNLDAELRVFMRLEITRLHERLGNTMIYVTHDQVEAMTMADKIVVLRKGVIEQVGRATRALQPAMQHLCRRLHRVTTDELRGGRNHGGGWRYLHFPGQRARSFAPTASRHGFAADRGSHLRHSA